MFADLSRTELLIGKEAMSKLRSACVCVVGLGGVGSFAVEALARAGIGKLLLVDFDVVGPTNLNRQLIALQPTIGFPKTQIMEERAKQINPEIEVVTHQVFIDSENRASILHDADIIIDAIDSLGPKIGMLEDLARLEKTFISVMGAGNRLDPSKIQIASLEKSHACPLARRVRKFLRRRGVKVNFPCVFTSEPPLIPDEDTDSPEEIIVPRGRQRKTIGSISYMPAIMGMMAASWVIKTVIDSEI